MRTSDVRLLRRLVRGFQRTTGVLLGNSACSEGLTFAQCHVLLELEEAGESALGALAARLGLDKSTVSRTVDGLVGLELIARATDPSDRRYSLLSLTPAGGEKAALIHRINDEVVRGTFDLIPRDRHADIIEAFRILVEASAQAGRDQSAGRRALGDRSQERKRRTG